MSVEKLYRADGTVRWRVRWREAGRNRAASFDRKGDAEDFEGALRKVKASGGLLAHRRGDVTVAEYASEWWEQHAEVTCTRRTLDVYAVALDNRILPLLGDRAIRDVTPLDVEDFAARLRAQGVGDPSVLKALAVLQAIFTRARKHQLRPDNPVELAAKPSAKRARTPVLLTPVSVEKVRSVLLHGGTYSIRDGDERHLEGDRHRDAALVSLLAYSGPRPESEGVTLTWDRVLKRNIVYRASKKKGAERTVKLLDPLAEDLAAWRMRSGLRRGLVFPAAHGDWQRHDWRNWQRRIFKPACLCAGLPADTRARDLRGSFASLLIWSGMDDGMVAAQLGHSIQTCKRLYQAAFDEVRGSDLADPAEAIRRARGETTKLKEAQ